LNELPTSFRPTLEDENGNPLADLGLLAKPTRLAIVSWLLVFFIKGASSSRCSAAGSGVAARGEGAAAGDASDRLPQQPVGN
jgi:hypothetical protein